MPSRAPVQRRRARASPAARASGPKLSRISVLLGFPNPVRQRPVVAAARPERRHPERDVDPERSRRPRGPRPAPAYDGRRDRRPASRARAQHRAPGQPLASARTSRRGSSHPHRSPPPHSGAHPAPLRAVREPDTPAAANAADSANRSPAQAARTDADTDRASPGRPKPPPGPRRVDACPSSRAQSRTRRTPPPGQAAASPRQAAVATPDRPPRDAVDCP